MLVSELLDSPEKWVQGVYATDKNDTSCFPYNQEACRWCLAGAIIRCYGIRNCWSASYGRAIDKLRKLIRKNISDWNDAPGRTFDEVRKAVLEAGI